MWKRKDKKKNAAASTNNNQKTKIKNKKRRQHMLEIKATIMGTNGVGKTTLFTQFVMGYFERNRYQHDAIGDDSARKQCYINEQVVMVDIQDYKSWDAWPAMPDDMALLYSDAVMFVYSVLDIRTLDAFRQLHKRAQDLYAGKPTGRDKPAYHQRKPHLPWFVLVGTRLDQVDLETSPRQVSYEQGLDMAKEMGCVAFYELSGATFERGKEAFDALIRPAMDYDETHEDDWDSSKKVCKPLPGVSTLSSQPLPSRSMADDMRAIINSQAYSDISLISAEGLTIHANRMILLTRHPSILEGLGPDDTTVQFADIEYKYLLAIVEWIYTGRTKADNGHKDVQNMLKAITRLKAYELLPHVKAMENMLGYSQDLDYYSDSTSIDTHSVPSFALVFNEQPFSDISFIFTTAKVLAAHRIVLVARCEYFRRMFESGFKETYEREIVVSDIEFGAFKLMLYFLYTDSIDGCPGIDEPGAFVQDLLALSERYLLPDLRVACEKLLIQGLQVANAARIYQLAHQLQLEATVSAATSFILSHYKAVSKTKDYSRCVSKEDRAKFADLHDCVQPCVWTINTT